jgi:hypothetical protein
MAREAEVVVGSEHEDALAIDDGLGTFVALQRLEEGVDVPGLGQFDQVESASLLEDVSTLRIVVEIGGKSVYIDGFREVFVDEGLGL